MFLLREENRGRNQGTDNREPDPNLYYELTKLCPLFLPPTKAKRLINESTGRPATGTPGAEI
jgi:hypothetical protein